MPRQYKVSARFKCDPYRIGQITARTKENEMTQAYAGQVALVTGATRGIGKAIAELLASGGATVIGTATSESGAQTITEYLNAQDNPGRGMVLNVTAAGAIDELVSQVQAEFGKIDILVNNAGITRDNLLMRMKD